MGLSELLAHFTLTCSVVLGNRGKRGLSDYW
jgi:hypothetical protein